jgi:hypothetical protein
MCCVLRFEGSRNAVSQQDVEVLVGVIATVTGSLLGGDYDPQATEKFAERFVTAGLLDRGPDGELPSAGAVALALEDLVQRLRYACDDYDDRPRSLPSLVAHVLELPSHDAALNCQRVLPDGQVRDATVRGETAEAWVLQAFYPELPPDPGFKEREKALRRVVAGFGGRYSGSQRPAD